MSKAQRLRLTEVRDIYRLVGECRELGADSLTWRRHAMDRLRGLIGAQVAEGGETAAPLLSGMQWFIQFVDVGWDSSQARRIAEAYHRDQMLTRDPFVSQFARLPGRSHTRSPEQIVEPKRWLGSIAFNEYFRAAGFNAGMLSQQALDGGTLQCFSFHRSLDGRMFSRRERRLVHLFHQEIARLIGRSLAAAREPAITDLAPRVRQTLDCLLEGDSEKQVAARLGLSQATVHEYVGTLYRHFGVTSRAELLAYFLRRFRGGHRP